MDLARKLRGAVGLFGLDIDRFVRVWPGLIWYMADRRAFLAQRRRSGHAESFAIGKSLPCLNDRHVQGGTASGMYFHQDLIAAQMIYKDRPERHVDVGSRVDGFVAHVAVFCPVEVLDIRRITTAAANISFRQADLMQPCDDLAGTVRSLSCLNVLEHFGLGRYGDPIDFDGHRKGFANLVKLLAPGGKFYFAVPISSRQRVEFNAHRLFSLPYLLAMFEEQGLDVQQLHYIDDNGDLHSSLDWRTPQSQRTFDLTFGCGVFALQKRV